MITDANQKLTKAEVIAQLRRLIEEDQHTVDDKDIHIEVRRAADQRVIVNSRALELLLEQPE